MLRRLNALLLAMIMLSGAARASVQLEFWASSRSRAAEMETAVRLWNESQPGRSITLHTTVFEKDLMHERVWTMLHSGVLQAGLEYPDFVDIDYRNLADYINPLNLQFYPVIEAVGNDPGMAYDVYSYQNMYVGIPTDNGFTAMIYNREKLLEAGIDPKDIHSWEDLKEAGKLYHDASGGHLLAIDMEHYLCFLTLYLQVAAGGSTEPYADTLGRLADMIACGAACFMPGGRADSRSFAEAFIGGDVAAAVIRRDDIDETGLADTAYIGEIPKLGPEKGVWIPGYAVCVTTHCKDYALVLDFLKAACPKIAPPGEGILCPGNAERLQDVLDGYKLDLAARVLK